MKIKPFLAKIKYVASTSDTYRTPEEAMIETVVEALQRVEVDSSEARIIAKYAIADKPIITLSKDVEGIIEENFQWWYERYDEDEERYDNGEQ